MNELGYFPLECMFMHVNAECQRIWESRMKSFTKNQNVMVSILFVLVFHWLHLFQSPPKVIAEYRNPCWYEPLNSSYSYTQQHEWGLTFKQHKQNIKPLFNYRLHFYSQPWRMRCLPYFYLIGQPKSGTTDLFYKLQRHPKISMGLIKEPHWWTRKRIGKIS